MRNAINKSIGNFIYVPSRLLFPYRQGNWNRHDYQVGKIVNIGTHKKDGSKMFQVKYYDLFRNCKYEGEKCIPLGEVIIKWFFAKQCGVFIFDINNPRYSYLKTL